MYQLYALIVFLATTIGAIAGLGGGVIIKPMFDLLGYHDAQTISVLSAFAVFTMSVVSLIKHRNSLVNLKLSVIIAISLGSFCGGLIGELIFNIIKQFSGQDNIIKLIQSTLLFFVLFLIVLYEQNKSKIKTYKLRNLFAIFMTGIFLGTISVFLGIGGGPLNIIFMIVLFSFNMKESVIYSISTVFFAQLSKLTQIYVFNQFKGYNNSLILWICIFAVCGGYIGTKFNIRLRSEEIEKVYRYTMVFLMVITFYNIFICIKIACA